MRAGLPEAQEDDIVQIGYEELAYGGGEHGRGKGEVDLGWGVFGGWGRMVSWSRQTGK